MSGTKENVKITALEVENLKRVKAVALSVQDRALTVIGGRNGQGKTSVLDAIMWALGGDRFKPTNPVRSGQDEAYVKIDLDNGVTVERAGKNGTLKVTSSRGNGGQALLNEFVNQFALNIPRFMAASSAEKAKMLLDVYPDLGKELARLNAEAKRLFDERHAMGQIADRKAKYADELPWDFSLPEEPLSGAEMAAKLQAALSVNSRNQARRQEAVQAEESVKAALYRTQSAQKRVGELRQALEEAESAMEFAQREHARLQNELGAARKTAAELQDEDTTAIQKELEHIDSINAAIRSNQSKKAAQDEANYLKAQYQAMTEKLEAVRADRIKLLASVQMPLDGLSLDESGDLIYRGQPWDCMSGAEQLRAAAAICAAVNPKCGFVLLDKLEAMDPDSLAEFAGWLAERNLQAIGTRVGTGDECSIVIENGEVVEKKEEFKF